MSDRRLSSFPPDERAVYSVISQNDGLKARDISSLLGLSRTAVNHILFSSPLMRELCFQDNAWRWHALIRQASVHEGLYEFSGWYGTVRDFLSLPEDEWFHRLQEGCKRIGRNLNDTRGLFHSFPDCGRVMRSCFADLSSMMDDSYNNWEIVFEFRLNRSRMIRIYADVLVIAPGYVFSLEFKMKNRVETEEVFQAAKYSPFLEVVFGQKYEIIPALILTGADELFEFVSIGETDMILPVSSGNMLFNVFNEYLGFLH